MALDFGTKFLILKLQIVLAHPYLKKEKADIKVLKKLLKRFFKKLKKNKKKTLLGKYSLLPDCSKKKNGWEKRRVFYLNCLYWRSGFYVNPVPHNSKRFSRSSSLIITWNLLIKTEIWPHTNNLAGDSREKILKKFSV